MANLGTMAKTQAIVDENDTESSEAAFKPAKKKWFHYMWDTFDKSPEERKLLFKLDSAILTFASLAYLIKSLDQVNINTAFVSGMKEDLGLYKNQLNYMQSCWAVGYVVGQIPSNMLLTRIRPRYWLPTMELIWTILTFCLSKCSTPMQIYILRFFIGLTESTFYPGMQYIIGSWYRKDELAKRSCIFHTMSAFGSMISGYLMAGVYNLGNVGGLKSWQWLFIIDGVISLPIALSGYFLLPDVPEISNPWYLTKEEVALACERMRLEGRRNRAPYTKAKFKKIFSSWHIYTLTLLFLAYGNISGGQPVFQQYLKYSKDPVYTIPQINAYPTTTYAVQIITTLIYAWASDTILHGRRWPPMIFACILSIACYIPLVIWDVPAGLKWACYILAGASYGLSGLCMAWAQEICSDDTEERALVIGSMNTVNQVFQAWLPQLVWKQLDAPQYRKGFSTSLTMAVIMIAMSVLVRNLQNWENNRRKRTLEGASYECDSEQASEKINDQAVKL